MSPSPRDISLCLHGAPEHKHGDQARSSAVVVVDVGPAGSSPRKRGIQRLSDTRSGRTERLVRVRGDPSSAGAIIGQHSGGLTRQRHRSLGSSCMRCIPRDTHAKGCSCWRQGASIPCCCEIGVHSKCPLPGARDHPEGCTTPCPVRAPRRGRASRVVAQQSALGSAHLTLGAPG